MPAAVVQGRHQVLAPGHRLPLLPGLRDPRLEEGLEPAAVGVGEEGEILAEELDRLADLGRGFLDRLPGELQDQTRGRLAGFEEPVHLVDQGAGLAEAVAQVVADLAQQVAPEELPLVLGEQAAADLEVLAESGEEGGDVVLAAVVADPGAGQVLVLVQARLVFGAEVVGEDAEPLVEPVDAAVRRFRGRIDAGASPSRSRGRARARG